MKVRTTAKSSDQPAGTCRAREDPEPHGELPGNEERRRVAEEVPMVQPGERFLPVAPQRHREALVGHEE
jgi:hypothetical protein